MWLCWFKLILSLIPALPFSSSAFSVLHSYYYGINLFCLLSSLFLFRPTFIFFFFNFALHFFLNSVFFDVFMWILISFPCISSLPLSPYFCLIHLHFFLVFISNNILLHFVLDRIQTLSYSISYLIPPYFFFLFLNLISSMHFLPREGSHPWFLFTCSGSSLQVKCRVAMVTTASPPSVPLPIWLWDLSLSLSKSPWPLFTSRVSA